MSNASIIQQQIQESLPRITFHMQELFSVLLLSWVSCFLQSRNQELTAVKKPANKIQGMNDFYLTSF